MKQGDIVTISFPYTNLKIAKKRPALVVSNENFHKSNDLLLVGISTKPGPLSHSIKISNKSLSEGRLLKESYVKFTNVMSFEKRLVLKKIGRLSPETVSKVYQKFNSLVS